MQVFRGGGEVNVFGHIVDDNIPDIVQIQYAEQDFYNSVNIVFHLSWISI